MPEQALPSRPEPDSSRVFALLLKLGLEPQDAYAFVHEVQYMASENLIARFESKLEANAAAQNAKLDVIRADIRSVKWVLGALVATLTLLFAAGRVELF